MFKSTPNRSLLIFIDEVLKKIEEKQYIFDVAIVCFHATIDIIHGNEKDYNLAHVELPVDSLTYMINPSFLNNPSQNTIPVGNELHYINWCISII